ncbi:MAG TPA: phosphoribosyltransferase family protein [Rhizomicrobium sp.]|jgi:putative phosphoribosyl transferase|nr:phosphoribosyltransferase family protein [Rhizomicrobium sp.]
MFSAPFADRNEAGRLLAAELAPLADRRPVVFGLPRCGVPVAYEIAQHLGAPLDVVLVRTVRAPDDRSRLLATVLEGDPPEVRVEPDWDRAPAVSRAWLDAAVSEALHEIDRRRRRYRGGDRPVSPAGRVAIVVDQAIGPGHAMAGAIRLIRDARPSMIVAATPVASQSGAERFTRAADKVICLRREAELGPLDRYYGRSQQVTHEEALDCLARAAEDAA